MKEEFAGNFFMVRNDVIPEVEGGLVRDKVADELRLASYAAKATGDVED